jgi:hypothetical protein
MLSINDVFFIIWVLLCISAIFVTPGKISEQSFSRLIAMIFILSCFATVWFHETVIDVSQVSPVHGATLALAQLGTLTLTSKLWFTINYPKLNRLTRVGVCIFLYTALAVIVIGSYWLYKLVPELQLLLYPFSSLAISLTAEILEDRWTAANHNKPLQTP